MRNARLHSTHAATARTLSAALLLGCAFNAVPAHAEDTMKQHWEHKQWRSVSYENGQGELHCSALAGADGDDTFRIDADTHGNFRIEFQELLVSGYPSNLQADDEILFTIEGKAPMTYDDVTVFDERDEYGDRVLRAAMPSGYAAEITGLMRKGEALTVQRVNATTHQHEVIKRFPLAGFTANLLKIGEWCSFDPNHILVP